MSALNRAWHATKRTARKISNKTEEVFDAAATSVKIKNLEAKIDEKYEELGRIVYRDLHVEEDLEESKLATVAAIDALFDRITELKAHRDDAKAAKAARKAKKVDGESEGEADVETEAQTLVEEAE